MKGVNEAAGKLAPASFGTIDPSYDLIFRRELRRGRCIGFIIAAGLVVKGRIGIIDAGVSPVIAGNYQL